MIIRDVAEGDAAEISAFLTELVALGKRTSPSDHAFVLSNYICDPNSVRCSVAEDTDGSILGFQSLKVAQAGNIYGVTPGWGIIGTHIRPSAARRGVGRALFAVTRRAAADAVLSKIDASIGETSSEGLAYYEAMGFRTYRTPDGLVCKCFDVTP